MNNWTRAWLAIHTMFLSLQAIESHYNDRTGGVSVPKITLFAAPGSCARVTMTALEHIGLPFEYRLIRMMTGEHKSPDYLAINPKGKVPALEVDNEVLTENVAILTYLSRRYPEAGLLPTADDEMTATRQLADLCYCSATLHPIVTRIKRPNFFAETEDARQQVRKLAIEAMRPNFDLIENRLSAGSWWYGEQWSVVDAYIYWVWFRSTDAQFPRDEYANLNDFAERMGEQNAIKKMLARESAAERQLREEGLI